MADVACRVWRAFSHHEAKYPRFWLGRSDAAAGGVHGVDYELASAQRWG